MTLGVKRVVISPFFFTWSPCRLRTSMKDSIEDLSFKYKKLKEDRRM